MAGSFYPGSPEALRNWIAGNAAPGSPPPGKVRALVAPHAGYIYSGALAAAAYSGVGDDTHRVFLLGPSHHVPLSRPTGCTHTAWRTPLGESGTDRDLAEAWRARGWQEPDDQAHAPEHALETHLPFLQTRLPGVPFFPLLTSLEDDPALAEQLDKDVGEGDIVAVSSDLSHFLPDDLARETDEQTAAAVEAGAPSGVLPEGACGWMALRALIRLAAHRGWQPCRIGLRTSADAGGRRDRVVGYGAWWFCEPQPHAQP